MTRFNVGDRVEEVEQLGLSKVIAVRDEEDGRRYYRLRQYAHPHRIIWNDEVHVSSPTEMRHDSRNEQYWTGTEERTS